jgi:PAS domain S-box-containing protein
MTTNLKRLITRNSILTLILQYFVVLALVLGISALMHDSWVKHLNIYHTVLELICIFIAMSIFMCVWYTYRRNTAANQVLAFGYLAVVIFDALHTFYFLRLDLSSKTYFDLSTRYWILGRLAEAVFLLLSVSLVKVKFNKWINLFMIIILTLGISKFMISYHNFLPVLLTEQGVTPIKVAMEYVIICLYMVTLYKLKNKIKDEEIVIYKYIFLALLMTISSEFCFTLYTSVTSISWTVGHVLKITSYYYLFKGIYISTVTYPYERLSDKNRKLEEAHMEVNHISETLTGLINALPIAIVKYDLNSRVKYVNKKFEIIFDCNKSELEGLTRSEFIERFSEDDNPIDDKMLEKGVTSVVKTYKTSKGERIKLSVSSQKISDGLLVLLNETRKDQELQNLHIQTETIINAVNSCIWMIDKDKKIVQCNDALAEVYEIHKKEILGMDIDRFNELTAFEARELPDLALSGNYKNQLYEVSFTSFKGNRKELLLHLSSIKNVDGDIIGAASVSTDITELKKEQQKMLQQEKLALLGQMGAGIVHETRNYLSTIKGRCQLIEILAQAEKVREHAIKINSEVDEVNRIISEFLFLSKPRETELEEISLLDVFESIKGMVETTSLVKGVDVDFELSREERYLLCDESQLKQVILNICKNAVDAMTDMSHAKLSVKTGYSEVTNEMFIKVADNGKGISEEDLKKIGTPFFTTKASGTGLGLNACYKIINEHNGRIDVESKLGKGTTFTVILPCIEDDDFEDVNFDGAVNQ